MFYTKRKQVKAIYFDGSAPEAERIANIINSWKVELKTYNLTNFGASFGGTP